MTHREEPRGHICDNSHRRVRGKAAPSYHPRRPSWAFDSPSECRDEGRKRTVQRLLEKGCLDLCLLFPPRSTSREELACVSPQLDERMDVPASK